GDEELPVGLEHARRVAARVVDVADRGDAAVLDRDALLPDRARVHVDEPAADDDGVGRRVAHRDVDQRTAGTSHDRASTTISISTGMLPGRTLVPMAARACTPRSPKTSSSSSEAPSTTAEVELNPGAQLTKASIFTIRPTRSRSPSSARRLARQETMHSRAAS